MNTDRMDRNMVITMTLALMLCFSGVLNSIIEYFVYVIIIVVSTVYLVYRGMQKEGDD